LFLLWNNGLVWIRKRSASQDRQSEYGQVRPAPSRAKSERDLSKVAKVIRINIILGCNPFYEDKAATEIHYSVED
jgi:hypothetical protein